MITKIKKIILTLVLIAGIITILSWNKKAVAPEETSSQSTSPSIPEKVNDSIYDPSRITKKLFGTYVTPQNSPVQPERFSGYHTGVDCETTPAEADIDIPVPAFCDGKLLVGRTAAGYGGVAVQSCILKGRAVTIIYGHLKISSIIAVGTVLKKGDKIGILGKGYSEETSGERKHLHFGIHRGAKINILGYVQKQSDLSVWLDPVQFLK